MARIICAVPKRSYDPGTGFGGFITGASLADRPASAEAGTKFVDLATGTAYTYTGSAWRALGFGGTDSGVEVATSTQQSTTDTYASDNVLQFEGAANASYSIRYFMQFDGVSSQDFKHQLIGPGSPTAVRVAGYAHGYPGTVASSPFSWTAFATSRSESDNGSTGGWVSARGILVLTTGGTVAVQWGQVSASANAITRHEGAYIRWSRFA